MTRALSIPDETIGLAGDWHGNTAHAFEALREFRARGVGTVIQLGDFGFTWADTVGVGLRKLTRMLERHDMHLYWLDGNHEDFIRLDRWELDDRGVRPMGERITHLPRGTRLSLHAGMTAAILGGAGSHDLAARKEGKSWWPEEAITEADLVALGTEPADVLLGHEVPFALDVSGEQRVDDDPADFAYTTGIRAMFNRGFEQVRPRLTVGGHWHQLRDQTVTTTPADGRGPFQSRMIVLDRDNDYDNPWSLSQALLTPATLDVDPFTWRKAPARG